MDKGYIGSLTTAYQLGSRVLQSMLSDLNMKKKPQSQSITVDFSDRAIMAANLERQKIELKQTHDSIKIIIYQTKGNLK